MASLSAPRPTRCSFATPFEWGRIPVPGAGDRFQPSDDFIRFGRMLSCQRTPFQDTLH